MGRTYSLIVRHPSGLKAVARLVMNYSAEHPRRRAFTLALSGSLGAGKTTFTRTLAQMLGARSRAISPSFVLMRSHAIPGGRFIHIDAWRLETCEARDDLGLRDLLSDPRHIVAIEWADRIRSLIPRSAVWISFRHRARGGRTVTVHMPS